MVIQHSRNKTNRRDSGIEGGESDMKLIQTLDKPVNGYWDGGAKQRFEWTVYGPPVAGKVRVGSWEANHFFSVKPGKTEKETMQKARRHLKRVTRYPSTFEYIA